MIRRRWVHAVELVALAVSLVALAIVAIAALLVLGNLIGRVLP